MKLNLDSLFRNLDGTIILGNNGKPLSLKEVIATSLSSARTEMEATKAWKMAQEIFNSVEETYEVTVAEAGHIKKAIEAHSWITMIVAQAHNFIEGNDEKS